MKKTTFYTLFSLVFVVLYCNDNTLDIAPEPTIQERILGTWQIDSAYTDINRWSFEDGEATVEFLEDSTAIFTNNGSQRIIPLGENSYKYWVAKICGETRNPDADCLPENKLEYLIIRYNNINDSYNSIRFDDNNLVFGQNYADMTDFICSKLNVSTK